MQQAQPLAFPLVKPITVFVDPFGLPLFCIFGGNLTEEIVD